MPFRRARRQRISFFLSKTKGRILRLTPGGTQNGELTVQKMASENSRWYRLSSLGIVSFILIVLLTGCSGFLREEPRDFVRVMTYNIHHGAGMDGRIDIERIASVIQQAEPDLVALQEVDRGAQRTERIDQIVALAELTNMAYAFGKTIELEGGGDYGIAVLTRFPIIEEHHYLYAMKSRREQRGLMKMIIDIDGAELVMMNTHLDHDSVDTERLNAISQIPMFVDSADRRPKILCGDFNDTPQSATLQGLMMFYFDGWNIVERDSGFTFPAGKPVRRIDYLLTDRKYGPDIVRASIPVNNASDHYPVIFDIVVTGRGMKK